MKLKYIQDDIDGRRRVANYYLENIKSPWIILPTVVNNEGHVWHLFVVRVRKREHFQKYLSENGIQTLIHYPIPPHKQEAYKEFNKLSFPITERIHNEIVSLPLSAVISMNELKKVVNIVNNYNV